MLSLVKLLKFFVFLFFATGSNLVNKDCQNKNRWTQVVRKQSLDPSIKSFSEEAMICCSWSYYVCRYISLSTVSAAWRRQISRHCNSIGRTARRLCNSVTCAAFQTQTAAATSRYRSDSDSDSDCPSFTPNWAENVKKCVQLASERFVVR